MGRQQVHTSSALSQLSPAPSHPAHHMLAHTHPLRLPRAPGQTHSRKGGKKSSERLTSLNTKHSRRSECVCVCTRSQITRCWWWIGDMMDPELGHSITHSHPLALPWLQQGLGEALFI